MIANQSVTVLGISLLYLPCRHNSPTMNAVILVALSLLLTPAQSKKYEACDNYGGRLEAKCNNFFRCLDMEKRSCNVEKEQFEDVVGDFVDSSCVENDIACDSGNGDADNPCVSDICQGGVCTEAYQDAGTPCGDATESECNLPDTCDGYGQCLSNYADPETPCGDPTDTDCDMPDTCDGNGQCLSNYADSGTSCGDATSTSCDVPDTCDGAGNCNENLETDGTTCDNGSTNPCETGECQDGTCATVNVDSGVSCGQFQSCNGNGQCLFDVIIGPLDPKGRDPDIPIGVP